MTEIKTVEHIDYSQSNTSLSCITTLFRTQIRLNSIDYRGDYNGKGFSEELYQQWETFENKLREEVQLQLVKDTMFHKRGVCHDIHFHKDSISGNISVETRNLIIATILKHGKGVSEVRMIDVYEKTEVVDVFQFDQRTALFADAIKEKVFDSFKTIRTKKYHGGIQAAINAFLSIPELSVLVNGSVKETVRIVNIFIKGLVESMVNEGLILTYKSEDSTGYRSLNKTELKKYQALMEAQANTVNNTGQLAMAV